MINYCRNLFAQPPTYSPRTLQPQQIGLSAESQAQFKTPPTESLAKDILAAKKAEEKLKTQHGCDQKQKFFIENKRSPGSLSERPWDPTDPGEFELIACGVNMKSEGSKQFIGCICCKD